jgi:hypothetical protein
VLTITFLGVKATGYLYNWRADFKLMPSAPEATINRAKVIAR